jgi:transcription elongation GreA/GreB family factor
MDFKRKIYQQFFLIIKERIALLQNILNDLRESIENETKSTAGDKHETALAMLHIEQENTRNQLNDAMAQLQAFEKIDSSVESDHVIIGSLIVTDRGYFFLSAALGKLTIDGITVTAVSPLSPLGKQLKGLKAGDAAVVNGNKFLIQSIG